MDAAEKKSQIVCEMTTNKKFVIGHNDLASTEFWQW